MRTRYLWLGILAVLLLFCAGCVSVGENNNENLPWSQPAGWEDQMLGVPY